MPRTPPEQRARSRSEPPPARRFGSRCFRRRASHPPELPASVPCRPCLPILRPKAEAVAGDRQPPLENGTELTATANNKTALSDIPENPVTLVCETTVYPPPPSPCLR